MSRIPNMSQASAEICYDKNDLLAFIMQMSRWVD